MKHFVFLLLLSPAFTGHTQLLNKDVKSNYSTRYYFESQRMQMFRTLASNDAFLPTPLGTRAGEISQKAWSHQSAFAWVCRKIST